MKVFSFLLFDDVTDAEYSEEWAVIAESPEQAERLLRLHFGGRWTWPKKDIVVAEGEVAGPADVIGKVDKE